MQDGPSTPESVARIEAPKPKPLEMLRNAANSRLPKTETTSPGESDKPPHQRSHSEILRNYLDKKEIPFDDEGRLTIRSVEYRTQQGEITTLDIIMVREQTEQGQIKIRVYEAVKKEDEENYSLGREIQIIEKDGRITFKSEDALKADRIKQQSSESPQTQTEGEEKKENEEQKPAETDSSKVEEQIIIEPLSEEDARKYIEIFLTDAVYGDIIAKDPQIRETLIQVLSGQEPARADLEALAERFGFITPALVGKALESLGIPSADQTATDENGQTINLRQALKTMLEAKEKSKQLSPEERTKLEIIRKLESAPAILTGKDVAEIFAIIDPNAFKRKKADQITIGDILTKTYQKMTGEEKKILRARKTEIEKQRKQKNQEEQQTSKQPEEEETPQETQEKQEQQQTEQQQIKSDIQALLETLGIETEEAKKFLGKTLVELIDENNQAIQEGRGLTIEVKDLKNFIDIFSKHEKALELYKQEIQNRLNTAGKVGIGAMAILLMLIWASSKDRQQGGIH